MSFWITAILVGFVTMAGFWMPIAPAAAPEVQHVQLGSTITLGCNISYLYDTSWLKHNPELTPTVVLCATLREGRPVPGCQLSPRFSVSLINRSLALSIAGVEERDLGLYYCMAKVNTHLTVGSGTLLQVSPPGSLFLLHHWYCVVVGLGLLIMVLAVCVSHWKARKSNKEAANKTPTVTTMTHTAVYRRPEVFSLGDRPHQGGPRQFQGRRSEWK